MKKLLFILLSLSTLVSKAQGNDTLDYFYLNRSNYRYESRLNSYFDDDMKQRSEKYYDWLKDKTVKYYSFWDGDNEFIEESVASSHFTLKEDASYIGTDYFEVHFAKRYMDSTYMVKTITEGEILYGKYVSQNKRNTSNDYLKVLEKAKKMIPADDFFLMFTFAEKLKKEICFMRINGETNQFFLLIGDNSKFGISDYMSKNYKKLTSSEIPEHYVIQTEFKLE